MLLIGDVHINSTYWEDIIKQISDFIKSNNDEKNIIFLWDFVYHFSYDRKSLLAVFDLFVELFKQDKNLYILAWNHDWISDNFVFLEWQKSFDIINSKSNNKVKFLTEPQIEKIEWKDILFFPHNYKTPQKIWKFSDPKTNIQIVVNKLLESNNKYERISAFINKQLYEFLEKNSSLTVFHHHYFANTQFPWQKTRFSYKDISFHEDFLDKYPNATFVSGHLHSAFTHKNYFCTWSVWNTSFLEQNQLKFLYKYDPNTNNIKAENININPYILIEKPDITIDNTIIKEQFKKIFNENIANFTSDFFNVESSNFNFPEIKKITLTLYSDSIDYQNIYDIINKDILNNLKDIKIKRQKTNPNNIINISQDLQKDLQNSIANWKSLLQNYLQQKYGQNYHEYEDILKKLKIL